MKSKRPYVVTLDQVQIRRNGESATITYADKAVGPIDFKLGPRIEGMTIGEILKAWNDCVRAMQRSADEYVHVAVEIPLGKPQIEYFERGDQWTPRGSVLRCAISDENMQPVIYVDDRELSWSEFGRLITTYAGWGMRIIFVPDDRLEETPRIEVREPEGG